MTDRDMYSQEAEESVIGAVLTSPNCYDNIAAFLSHSDFFFLRHSYIWQAFDRIEKRHEPIDYVVMCEELKAMGVLAEIGGPAYLTQLISNTPTSVHAEVYGAMVRRIAERRLLSAALKEIDVLVYDQEMSNEEVFEQAESKLLSITTSSRKDKDTGINGIVNKYIDVVEGMREDGKPPAMPTGYSSIDNIHGGGYKQELTLIAAPPKSGKSSYNLNVARNRAKAGMSIVIFITEMTKQAVVRKFISMETGIPMQKLKDGEFSPQQYSRFIEASGRIAKWNMHIIDDHAPLTPLDIRRDLRRIAREEHIDTVLVDGLWMMESNRSNSGNAEKLSQIMVDLVNIGQKLNVGMDVVHQCNRAAESRRDPHPRLSDLADSSGPAQNAYTIMFLYRENYYKRNGNENTEIIVHSNRDGNVGVAELGFDTTSETYHEIEASPARYTQNQDHPAHDNRKDVYQ